MKLYRSFILLLSSTALISAADVIPANWTPGQKLIFYTVNGNIQEFNRLTKSGANLQFRDSSPGSEGETLLIKAATYGHANLAKLLLEAGLDINATDDRGETALLSACFATQKEMAQWLIQHGADVNKASKNGLTPLHVAADKDEPDLVQLLLQAGAKQNPSNNGFTPIMAASQRSTKSLGVLIDAGGNIDAERRDGRRAVHFASLNSYRYHGGVYSDQNDFKALELLLKKGVDLSKKDKKGQTFLDYVHERYKGEHLIGILKLVLKFQPELLLKNPKPVFVRKLYDTYFDRGYHTEKLDLTFLNEVISKSPAYANPPLDEDGFSVGDRILLELLKTRYRIRQDEVDEQLKASIAFLKERGILAVNGDLIRRFNEALIKFKAGSASRPGDTLRSAMLGFKEEDLQKLLAIYTFLNEDDVSYFHEYLTDRNIILYPEVTNSRYVEYLCSRRKDLMLIDYYHRFRGSGRIQKSFYEGMVHNCGLEFLKELKKAGDKTLTGSELLSLAINAPDYAIKIEWLNDNFEQSDLANGYDEATLQFSGYYQKRTYDKLLFLLRQKAFQDSVRKTQNNIIGNLINHSCTHGFKQTWAEEIMIIIRKLNALGLDINGPANAEEPPLIAASRCNSRYFVRKLLEFGAEAGRKNLQGNTALHFVLGGATAGVYPRRDYDNESPEISKSVPQIPNTAALIAADIISKIKDVNHINGHGYTPLMLAARSGRVSLVVKLLEIGADTKIKNRFGETAHDLAFYWHQTSITKELNNYSRRKDRSPFLVSRLLRDHPKGKPLDLKGREISPDLNRYLAINGIQLLNAERKAVKLSAGENTCYIMEVMSLRQPAETISALKDGYSPNCFSGPWTGNTPLASAFWQKDPVLLEALLQYGARPTISGKPLLDQITVIDNQLKAERLSPEIKEKLIRMKSIIKRYGN